MPSRAIAPRKVKTFCPARLAEGDAVSDGRRLQWPQGARFVPVSVGVSQVGLPHQCFCPSRPPKRCGNCKGHGTPLPSCAEVFLIAAAARGIGTDGACCCKSVHRVGPSIPWLWVRQITLRLTWPAGSGRVGIALHGLLFLRAVSPSLGAVNCGSRRKSLSPGAIFASSLLAGAASVWWGQIDGAVGPRDRL